MRKRFLAVVMLLSLAFMMPGVAMAHDGETESGSTSSTTSNSGTGSVSSERKAEIEKEVEDIKTNAQTRVKSREDQLKQIKADVQTHKAELKMDICEKRTTQLQQVLPKTQKGAKSVKAAIDKSYARVQEFYVSKNLNVSNYDTLVAAVEEAKANSETALTVVDSYDFKVDCSSQTIAGQLNEYRAAVKSARDSLKTYRSSVVDLIKGIKTAVQASAEDGSTTNE